jgi:2'-5' RNA ligase
MDPTGAIDLWGILPWVIGAIVIIAVIILGRKWVEIYNIHITLKFLGETSEDLISSISEELFLIKEKFSAFNIDISNIGIFGSSYAPKVIWIGVENEILKKLGNDVIETMGKVGFIADRQNFVPHITLGRIKKLEDKTYFQKLMESNKEKYLQTIYVDKFHLIESILHKTGPVYKIIETYDFKKS